MPNYCDSGVLEQHWFNWIVARAVPDLEQFRRNGALWTKIIGLVKDDDGRPLRKNSRTFLDPSFPVREHALTLKSGTLRFCSINGIVDITLPAPFESNTCDDTQMVALMDQGFFREPPLQQSWDAMLIDIYKICQGIGTKFTFSNEEEREDLVHGACEQVTNKLIRGRLVYVPGKAPVFNLLTTTIHRVMFSILSKNARIRMYQQRLAEDVQSGKLCPNSRAALLLR